MSHVSKLTDPEKTVVGPRFRATSHKHRLQTTVTGTCGARLSWGLTDLILSPSKERAVELELGDSQLASNAELLSCLEYQRKNPTHQALKVINVKKDAAGKIKPEMLLQLWKWPQAFCTLGRHYHRVTSPAP